ncbi:MAG TPA: lytic murein transglycosylase [Aestuariivirga sp.]|nr:lytic murein transglycosylase [Aestuariivirga sp.]
MIRLTLATLLLTGMSLAAAAQTCGKSADGFDGFKRQVAAEAKGQGYSAQAIAALAAVQYDPVVIKRDRAQNVFSQTFLQFSDRMVSNYRLKEGQNRLAQYRTVFDAVEKKYGVPGAVLVAFWGLETDFGANTGDFNTVQSLATLAWDCRRPEKFRPQLMAALDLISKGDLSPEDMRGAWAGEIGQAQFLPVEYDETAVDFDGDGRRDLRHSVPDIMASSARLLIKHGWKANQPWLQEVRVPDELPWDQADIAIQHPRSQWARWGVTAASGKAIKADSFPAALLLPMGKDGPAFLAYDNFTTAYLKWNESLVYSTTAAYFATRLGGAGKVNPGRGAEALTADDVMTLQKILAAKGYDVGKIDGKLGKGTRAAIKDQQVKLGLPADSWPTRELLAKLH